MSWGSTKTGAKGTENGRVLYYKSESATKQDKNNIVFQPVEA